MILVKVGRQGGKVVEMAYMPGIPLLKAIMESKVLFEDSKDEIHINGVSVSNLNTIVKDKDIILVYPNVVKKVTVKVARVGQPLMEVLVSKPGYIEKALVAGGMLPFPNEDIYLHRGGGTTGEVMHLKATYQLNDGDVLIIEKKKDPRFEKFVEIVESIFENDVDLYSESEMRPYFDRVMALK